MAAADALSHVNQSIEELIENAVTASIENVLRPYLVKLRDPEPLVYTVSQVATVLQVSPDTVARLVKRGVLQRVPHLDGKLLIPKRSVEALIGGAATDPSPDRSGRDILDLSARRSRRESLGL